MSAAAELRAAAESVRRFGGEWVRDASGLIAESIDAQLRADTGDGRLSNAHGYGAVDVQVTVTGDSATVRNAGDKVVWGWLEDGTNAHVVRARGRALRTPVGPRRSARVSGMAAKQTWTKGNDRGLDAAERAALELFNRTMG